MRLARPALAVTAALSLTMLAGCAAAATPEEKAEQEMKTFIAALNGDGDIAWCEGEDDGGIEFGAWALEDEDSITVEPQSEKDRWTVRADVHPVDDESRVQEQSIHVMVPEEGDPCVAVVYGFLDVTS